MKSLNFAIIFIYGLVFVVLADKEYEENLQYRKKVYEQVEEWEDNAVAYLEKLDGNIKKAEDESYEGQTGLNDYLETALREDGARRDADTAFFEQSREETDEVIEREANKPFESLRN